MKKFMIILISFLGFSHHTGLWAKNAPTQPPMVQENSSQKKAALPKKALPYPADTEYTTMTYGNHSAPLTLRAFTAYSCAHCSTFHQEQIPQLMTDYINNGKLRLIIEPYAMDGQSLRAILVVLSLPPEKQTAAAHTLFKNQKEWLFEMDLVTFHQNIADQLGISLGQVEKAVLDDRHGKAVIERRLYWENQYGIDGAPIFMVEFTDQKQTAPQKIDGFQPYDALKKTIDACLGGKATSH